MKNCLVVGLGNFGYYIAKTLYESGVDVLALDGDESLVSQYRDDLGVTICADASQLEQLESLPTTSFDAAVVAVGQDITSSVLITLHLQDLKIPHIAVRSISAEHTRVLEKLGVHDIISPEKDTALKVANKLVMKNVVDYLPLGDEYGIVEVAPPKSFIGKTLADLQITARFSCQLVGMKFYENHNEEKVLVDTIMAPKAYDAVTENCAMIVLGKREDIVKLQDTE